MAEKYDHAAFMTQVEGARAVLNAMHAQSGKTGLIAFLAAWINWHVENHQENAVPGIFDISIITCGVQVRVRDEQAAIDLAPEGKPH